jgi:RNA polymerase sigma-70 factor, ECF subfamily
LREEEMALLDEVTIREFLITGYPRVAGAVALVTGDLAAAEDAVQEALVRAWERSARGQEFDSLEAWVATVALNLSRSRLRRLITERRFRTKLIPGIATADVADDRFDVRRALAALPRRQREAAVLRYFLDLTTSEIAEAMVTSEGTVKSQLAKARAHLAKALALDPDLDLEADHADH